MLPSQEHDCAPPPAQPEPAHVLVVDDDSANRELLTRILQAQYQVTCANNGQVVLDLLTQKSFDVVLLDIMLPKINGLEVLKLIRNTPDIVDVPVILISALADGTDVVRGLEQGANDYLTKPSDPNVVLARVKTQITLKRLLDKHKRVNKELQETTAMRDEFFRVASHDLKTPLANIRMAEYILREMVGDDAQGRKILDTVHITVDNMEEVISDFLDTAAFHNRKVEIHAECLAVRDVIDWALIQFEVMAVQKAIQLQVGPLDGLIMADPARLKQVVCNLISNAIKYSPRGSTIHIWSEQNDSNGTVRIHIADQGSGIPENERYLLFTEFGKLSTRPTENESSTGLGLWIVKQLVTLQKGQVGVDCPPDGGSIFWVEFPMVECSEEA